MRTFELNNIIVTEKNANTATIKFNNLAGFDNEIVITRPDEQHKLFYASSLEVIKFYNNNTNCFDCFSPEPKPDNIFEYENTFDYIEREIKTYFKSQSKFIVSILNKVIYTKLLSSN